MQSHATMHVVYGSRTRRGLSHPNEDRHSLAAWSDWNLNAYTGDSRSEAEKWPAGELSIPTCIGSARKDTTLTGSGGTGGLNGSPLVVFGEPSIQGPCDPNSQSAYLWTVCDGHDGPEAAEFVCRSVGDAFSRLWHTNTYLRPDQSVTVAIDPGEGSEKTEQRVLCGPDGRTIPVPEGEDPLQFARGYSLSNALARTYEGLDVTFRSLVSGPSDAKFSGSTAGTCVTSVFLCADMVCCAGLGDCKSAILTLEEGSNGQQQFQVTWLSKEHRSNSPKERARVRARGGWFRHGRVGGVLEPTRTIGDFDVKDSQPPGVVIPTPEVRTFVVQKPAIVLIASDGLWDVMDAAQLLRTLKKRRRLWRGILGWLGGQPPQKRGIMSGLGFRRRAQSKNGLEETFQMPTGGDLVAMSDALVTRAHDLGSDDDCTCLCIFTRPLHTLQTHPPLEAAPEEEEDDEDDDDDEDDAEEDDPVAAAPPEPERHTATYEKWRAPRDDAEEDANIASSSDDNEWELAFPVKGADEELKHKA